MPQMAPMNWLILFIFFNLIFYLLMKMIYFNFLKTINNKSFKNNMIKNYNKSI
uniref:ATP synthase complex subunit 8 n=1 Tax=Colopha kansugei TaxID=372563 RepID=A0A096VKB4_9HEMI|nr:ATP synthase F0 subunit 8 [Colopha kansugei]AGI97899.1 ATP synthase F0 subunit 8 [Colopha kansugei]AHK17971.1 F-ATPase subunit 8 [Colopha kansugei]